MFWPTIRYVALTNLTNRWSYFLARRRARDSYAGGPHKDAGNWQKRNHNHSQKEQLRLKAVGKSSDSLSLRHTVEAERSIRFGGQSASQLKLVSASNCPVQFSVLISRWSERFMEIYWLQFKPTSVWIKKQTTSPSYLNINAMEYSRIQTMLLIMIGESSLWDRPSPAICTDIVSIYAECRYIKAAINKSRTSIC